MARPKRAQAEPVAAETDFEPETVEDVEAPEPVEEPKAPGNVFTNTTKGTTIHLGDGRKLAPGESAEVSLDLMTLLLGDAG